MHSKKITDIQIFMNGQKKQINLLKHHAIKLNFVLSYNTTTFQFKETHYLVHFKKKLISIQRALIVIIVRIPLFNVKYVS
jgi:hypothetical protein